MKIKFLIILIFFTAKNFSQTKHNDINCDSIKKGLFDSKIYTKLKGKYIMNVNLNKEKIFLIRNIETNKFYYVSKLTMKKIKKNNCEGIKIETPVSVKDKRAPKIVRD